MLSVLLLLSMLALRLTSPRLGCYSERPRLNSWFPLSADELAARQHGPAAV